MQYIAFTRPVDDKCTSVYSFASSQTLSYMPNVSYVLLLELVRSMSGMIVVLVIKIVPDIYMIACNSTSIHLLIIYVTGYPVTWKCH